MSTLPCSRPPNASIPTLLLVDDAPLVLRALTRMLRGAYDITLASNGREALELVRRGRTFDAILCDVSMPEMNGVAFCEALLRAAPAQAERLLFTTGAPETMRSVRSLLDTGARVLFKPFSVTAVRTALSVVRGMAEAAEQTTTGPRSAVTGG
jgi:CheY-like chemotaxis protein